MSYHVTAYASNGIDSAYADRIAELIDDNESIYHQGIGNMVGFVEVSDATDGEWPDADELTEAARAKMGDVIVDDEPYADNEGLAVESGWARYAIIPAAAQESVNA